jgi:lysophospholipase L1-like esterase
MGLGLSALMLELILRLVPVAAIEVHRRGPGRADHAAFFQYDPELGWVGRPHARGPFSGWESTSEVALNSRGFRDREVNEAKPPGIFRVVVLGDSITWGQGVAQTERYPDLLTGLLGRKGVPVEVVNLAVGGYGTDQEYLLFRGQGRRFCPDLVLLGLYRNDLLENGSAFQGAYPKPYFRVGAGSELLLENTPVPRLANGVARQTSGPSWGESSLKSFARRHIRLYAAIAFVRQSLREGIDGHPGPAPIPPESVEVTALLIRHLAQEVEHEGSRFAVVVLPDFHYSSEAVSALAPSGVAAFLDLTAVFRAAAGAGERIFYKLDGAHWTPRAHARAAEAIADFVARAQLLTRRPRACLRPPN